MSAAITCNIISLAVPNYASSYKKVLLNGFDESNHYPVTLSHFNPCSSFQQQEEQLIDSSNGDHYIDQTLVIMRSKCLLTFLVTPIAQAVGLLLNLVNRIAKLITFAHFWRPPIEAPHGISLETHVQPIRSEAALKDLLRVIFTPMIYIGLELSALYGIFLPAQGQKLYATFERCAYGRALIAALMTACGILPLQAVAIEIMKGDADLILLVTLIAPLAEEILFRGFIQERLEDIASMASHYLYPLSNAATMQIAAVAQSLLFGAIHIIGNQVGQRSMAIVVFGATSLLGLILAQRKNEHASLLPAIAIHSSQNTGFTLGLLGGQALRRAVIA